MHPTASESFLGFFGSFPIPHHHHVAAHDDFADLAGQNRPVMFIHDADLCSKGRSPCATASAFGAAITIVLVPMQYSRDRREFGHAIKLNEFSLWQNRGGTMERCVGNRRSTVHEPPQRREIV